VTAATQRHWFTLRYGVKSYIDAATKGFPPNHLFLNAPVDSLTNTEDGGVLLHLKNGTSKVFDHVIVATHPDQAHALILSGASAEERRILSGFETSKLTAILHSDLSLMPKSRETWSSWNYITKPAAKYSNVEDACLTYNMNIIQNIPEEVFGHVLVTTNPVQPPNPDSIQGRYTYYHPLYNSFAIRSQRLLPRIQNTRGISYCGAWTKYGSHEDGFSSGLKVAQDHLGAKLPFKFEESTLKRGTRPPLRFRVLLLRLGLVLIQIVVAIIERVLVAQNARAHHLKRQVKKWI
jgi:predicted NAD/FAD-binding protein